MATFATVMQQPLVVKQQAVTGSVLEINEDFTFRVLDDDGGHAARGTVAKLVGRRLIARVSEFMRAETCVRIDGDDSLVLGEVMGCWREGAITFAAIELVHALNGLDELAHFQERDQKMPRPVVTEIRRRA